MALFEQLRKVDVRAVLDALGAGQRVEFQLRPREFVGGRWQGGTYLEVRRAEKPRWNTRFFKIGTLAMKTLDEAVAFVNAAFDGYHTPRVMETDHDPSVNPVRRSRDVPQRAAHGLGQDPAAGHRQRQPKEAAKTRGDWRGS